VIPADRHHRCRLQQRWTRAPRLNNLLPTYMGLRLVEKIAAGHADGLASGTVVRSGDFISIRQGSESVTDLRLR
jgi:hypothetical protein